MEYVGEETIVEDDSGEGGWVETHHFDDATGLETVEEKLSEMTMEGGKDDQDDGKPEEMVTPDNSHNEGADDDAGDDDDDDPCDMEEFAESGMLEKMDPATAVQAPPKPEPPTAAAATSSKDNDGEGGIVKTRTYDLHITYDKYYQTPRLWVVGYDEVWWSLCNSNRVKLTKY